MTLRAIAIYTTIILGTLLLLFLAWVFQEGLLIFIFSLAVAAAARPLVNWLLQRGIARSLALVIIYSVAFVLIVMVVLLLGRSLLRELQVAADNLARTYDQIWRDWPTGSEIQQAIVKQLPAPADLYQNFSLEQDNSPLQPLLNFTIGSFNLFGQLVAVLILSIYWTIDQVHFERLWLSLLPVESRARARDIWRDIERDFGAYIRSEVLQSILAGLLLGIGYSLIGLPYPTLLALFGALVWLIPWLGGVLAVLPAVLVGLPLSLWLGLGAGVLAIAVLIFLEFFIGPRFTQRQFSSLLGILLILALVEPYGLLGFLVAPPLAAALELIFRYSLQTRTTPPLINESGEKINELNTRLDSIHNIIANRDDPPEPQVTSLLARLEDLLQRTSQEIKS